MITEFLSLLRHYWQEKVTQDISVLWAVVTLCFFVVVVFRSGELTGPSEMG